MGFITISIFDILDILIVSILMVQVYRLVRGTSAYYIIMGISLIYGLWLIFKVLHMELISTIMGQILGVGVIALIIVFQQELRKFLMFIGNKYFAERFFIKKSYGKSTYFDELVTACEFMSETLTGALIVIEQKSDLSFVKETGDKIDAVINQRLIENIFYKNSPLHDGAMVLTNNRIAAARCVLPSTDNNHIPAYYGMRHRAAIGVTEVSDAVVVVVSEQNGKISFVTNGKIERGITTEKLTELLNKYVK